MASRSKRRKIQRPKRESEFTKAKVPDWFQIPLTEAGQLIGREIHMETAMRNLKAMMLRTAGQSNVDREIDNAAFSMALLADEKGRFTATEEELAQAWSILFPVIDAALNRLGQIAACLIAGGPHSQARRAEMERRHFKENVTTEDIQFLNCLLRE